MDIPAVARRYARALYDFAVEEGVRDAVRADLAEIGELIRKTPELADFLENPTITPVVAAAAIAALLEEQAHSATMQFIRLLTSRGRMNQLRAVCDAFEQQACEDLGILKVTVTAAHALSEEQVDMMKQKLADRHRRTIMLDVAVDPSLLGGFKVQEGDRIRDFSIINKLEQFEQSVIHARHDHPKYKVKSWR